MTILHSPRYTSHICALPNVAYSASYRALPHIVRVACRMALRMLRVSAQAVHFACVCLTCVRLAFVSLCVNYGRCTK
jgi:hypothetical protein